MTHGDHSILLSLQSDYLQRQWFAHDPRCPNSLFSNQQIKLTQKGKHGGQSHDQSHKVFLAK